MSFLENYIKQNQEAFDIETPNISAWEGINQRLNALDKDKKSKTQAKVVSMPVWIGKIRVAASISAILVVGFVAGYFLKPQPSASSLSSISSEYAEMEQFYQTQINKKQKQLVKLGNDAQVESNLNEIDHVMQELQRELTNAPKGSREQIIRNMILSYKTKIGILERVIDEKSARRGDIVQFTNNTNNNEKDTI